MKCGPAVRVPSMRQHGGARHRAELELLKVALQHANEEAEKVLVLNDGLDAQVRHEHRSVERGPLDARPVARPRHLLRRRQSQEGRIPNNRLFFSFLFMSSVLSRFVGVW